MELQRRREATGMSREEVARQLEWSTSTIFRIETGRSRPQPGNVRTLHTPDAQPRAQGRDHPCIS